MRTMMIAAALLLSNAAQAGNTTGNSLHEDLNGRNAMRMASAVGYIEGIGDILHGTGVLCLSTKATPAALVETVRAWLQTNPGDRGRHGENVVGIALHEVWPCPAK